MLKFISRIFGKNLLEKLLRAHPDVIGVSIITGDDIDKLHEVLCPPNMPNENLP